MPITQAFNSVRQWWCLLWRTKPLVEVNRDLWQDMHIELRRRGLNGSREAGAFLLGTRLGNKRSVTKAVYFDDLDPDSLVDSIHFRGHGYSKLWDICEAERLQVLGDVHTHPSTSVTQSSIDRANPMIARVGHIALVLPHFGTHPICAREVGVHEYHAELGWKCWLGKKPESILRLGSS